MRFYYIATKYHGAQELAHAYNDDNKHDVVECAALSNTQIGPHQAN